MTQLGCKSRKVVEGMVLCHTFPSICVFNVNLISLRLKKGDGGGTHSGEMFISDDVATMMLHENKLALKRCKSVRPQQMSVIFLL